MTKKNRTPVDFSGDENTRRVNDILDRNPQLIREASIQSTKRTVWAAYWETRHYDRGMSLHATEADAWSSLGELVDVSDWSQAETAEFWQLLKTDLAAFRTRFYELLESSGHEAFVDEIELPAQPQSDQPTTTIYQMTIETRHFDFEVFGTSVDECRRLMQHAWTEHCRQTGAEDDYIANDIRDSEPMPITVPAVYRDRQKMELTTPVESESYEQKHARLTAAFEKVKPADHWKNPINVVIDAPTDAEREEITEAVIYFTGSVPEFRKTRSAKKIRVVAAGYFATIGA